MVAKVPTKLKYGQVKFLSLMRNNPTENWKHVLCVHIVHAISIAFKVAKLNIEKVERQNNVAKGTGCIIYQKKI